jgi:hypothetical protein
MLRLKLLSDICAAFPDLWFRVPPHKYEPSHGLIEPSIIMIAPNDPSLKEEEAGPLLIRTEA